jgi:hypothetical protein
MKPLEITKGRFRLLHSGGYVRIDMDGGGGLSVWLTKEEMLRLSLSLWRSARPLAPIDL